MEALFYIHKAVRFIESSIDFVKMEISREQRVDTANKEGLTRKRQWTGSVIEFVEMIYRLDEMKCINSGEVSILELVQELGPIYGIEVKDCYSAYVDMKRRKNESRTYFLDKMRERLNGRMNRDDEKERMRK